MAELKVNTNLLDVNPEEDASEMGCRTWNAFDINFDEAYFKEILDYLMEHEELPENYLYSGSQRDGRGNICPTTIILPTLAMQAKKKCERDTSKNVVEEFMKLLEEAIEDAKNGLLERYKWICSQSADSADFMYDNNVMLGYKPEEGIESALKHGTLAIGQLGLAEALDILIGKDHVWHKPTTEEMVEAYKEKYGKEPSKKELEEINVYTNKQKAI